MLSSINDRAKRARNRSGLTKGPSKKKTKKSVPPEKANKAGKKAADASEKTSAEKRTFDFSDGVEDSDDSTISEPPTVAEKKKTETPTEDNGGGTFKDDSSIESEESKLPWKKEAFVKTRKFKEKLANQAAEGTRDHLSFEAKIRKADLTEADTKLLKTDQNQFWFDAYAQKLEFQQKESIVDDEAEEKTSEAIPMRPVAEDSLKYDLEDPKNNMELTGDNTAAEKWYKALPEKTQHGVDYTIDLVQQELRFRALHKQLKALGNTESSKAPPEEANEEAAAAAMLSLKRPPTPAAREIGRAHV